MIKSYDDLPLEPEDGRFDFDFDFDEAKLPTSMMAYSKQALIEMEREETIMLFTLILQYGENGSVMFSEENKELAREIVERGGYIFSEENAGRGYDQLDENGDVVPDTSPNAGKRTFSIYRSREDDKK